MSGIEVRTLSLDGLEMDYLRFGGGERTLAVIPGLNLRDLRDMAHAAARSYRPFSEDYQVLILDRRRAVPPGYSTADMGRDTARALDALGIRRADVLGVSQGGMIAQYLALERPDLVGKLVLAVTMSRPNEAIRQAVGRWAELAERDDYEGLVTDVMDRMYSPSYLARFGRILPAISAMNRPRSLERFSILTRACLTCDTYDRLGEIRCPAFVVGGRQDKVLTGAASVEMAEKLGCELYMYEQLGHSVCEEAEDFSARVLEFLKR